MEMLFLDLRTVSSKRALPVQLCYGTSVTSITSMLKSYGLVWPRIDKSCSAPEFGTEVNQFHIRIISILVFSTWGEALFSLLLQWIIDHHSFDGYIVP